MLDLWGPSARSILVAGAKTAPDGVPIRFVQIGSAGGAEIAMPAAVLRSSAIEMKGSGLGSVGLPCLVAAIDEVVADSHLDDMWLKTLAAASGSAPPVHVEHVALLLEELGCTSEAVEEAQVALKREPFARHRARDDARWLARLIALATGSLKTERTVRRPLFDWREVGCGVDRGADLSE